MISWGALAIGIGIGLFLAIGSAYIIGKTMKLLSDETGNWSLGYALGLSSIWMSKVVAACAAIYFAQKAGFSTLYLGLGLPVGILLGVFLIKAFSNKK